MKLYLASARGNTIQIKKMSTGIPISIVDGDAPPASSGTGHGHGHGHSRSRGHSRSTRHMQAPSPISVPPSSLMAEVPSLQPVTGTPYSNGHASHPSWQGHHHSHSQSSVQINSLTPSPVKSVFHDHELDHDEEPDTLELATKPVPSHRYVPPPRVIADSYQRSCLAGY